MNRFQLENANDKSIKKSRAPWLCLILIACMAILPSCRKITPDQTTEPAGTETSSRESEITSEISMESDAFFLSMFPIDGFQEKDFKTYEGITLSKSSHVIDDQKALHDAFQILSARANAPKLIYLGLDPAKITPKQTLELLSMFPDADYKIFLENRPLSKWTNIPGESDKENLFLAYRDLVTALAAIPRVKVYPFFAQEWIIADPSNYDENDCLKEDVTLRMYLYALFSDELRDCRIQPDYVEDLFAGFHQLLSDAASGKFCFLDLSDYDIVFLGDSVFGNYTDGRSIPGQLHKMSNAAVYNCGWGGATASQKGERNFLQILDALLAANPDLLPEDSQSHIGLSELFTQKSASELNNDHTIFVLHFGANDYIQGLPVETADPLDRNSLCGAMRTGITSLQEAYPNAHVMIVIPNYLFAFEEGTEIAGEQGSVYVDYVAALIKVAGEFQLPFQDDYHQIIDCKRRYVHLDDGVHPNDYGKYQIAYVLMHGIFDEFVK